MKCTNCGLREATTEVVVRCNDRVQKLYLCADCAKNYRPDVGLDSFDVIDKLINGSPMALINSFGNIFNAPSARTLVCPDCKTTSEEFLKTGFVGCPRCYDVFEPLISQTVKKLQQSDMHVGKSPLGAVTPEAEEARLKSELQAAVDSGDYYKLVKLSELLTRLVGNKKEGE